MVQAFDRMRGHGLPAPARLKELLLAASDHRGPWPRIAVWHGSADRTVSVDNAAAIVAQWQNVHGLPDKPTAVDLVGQVPRRMRQGQDGRVLVEEYIVPGMAYGTPLKTSGTDAYGSSAPFMLDVGISSTLHIAAFWGSADAVAKRGTSTGAPANAEHVPVRLEPRRLRGKRVVPEGLRAPAGVGKVIEDALRAAGLMK
jgi:poly(3-hydroxybutyrate) depolymerase